MSTPPPIRVFGIRHHGPGSARSLIRALEAYTPDAILVEGPPDADASLTLSLHPDMQPPIALLIYAPDNPKLGVYYPFAVFSPEWQAIQFGLRRHIPVRFMDLPQAQRLAVLIRSDMKTGEVEADQPEASAEPPKPDPYRTDPLAMLAEAAGYSDGERWWDHMVEQRRGEGGSDADLFDGILEAMTALRAARPADAFVYPLENEREAWMRKTIRTAIKDGFQRIAVVCGAWHGPALANVSAVTAKADNDLLKPLPKIKTAAAWIPWTYERLTFTSGYGAGIESPGWYHYLWESSRTGAAVAIGWMAHVARLLREMDLDGSPAQVIDAVRLAEALAALRDRPIPGLPELNEAAQSALCFGAEEPMVMIWRKLIVSDRMGEVPDDAPMVPLQQDLRQEQKRLRLKPEAETRTLTLDLRTAIDLDRSRLLHRLQILGIGWGTLQESSGKGTFKEVWALAWQPEMAIELIEASIWGGTVRDAAGACARDAATKADTLPDLADLFNRVILADLPDLTAHLTARLQEMAALASDIAHLMVSLPALVRILRYSDVRKTDQGMVADVVRGLALRISVGLPAACASLDDQAAGTMYNQIMGVQGAMGILADEELTAEWYGALRQVADRSSVHGLVAGRCVRLLTDSTQISAAESARRFGLALSMANDPAQAAAWIEGYLKGSGQLLLYEDTLWNAVDSWLVELPSDAFTALLPLVRRTFATFTPPERRRMSERVRHRERRSALIGTVHDTPRADQVLPLLSQILFGESANQT